MRIPVSSLAMAVASAFLLTHAVPASAAAVPTGPREIARVPGEGGSYVAWLETPQGEVDVAVATTYPNRPIVAPRFMQTHTPSEIFLAVASERQALPDALAHDLLRSVDEETRANLQRANAAELAGMNLDFPRALQSLAPNCTQSFRDWVATVYGNATCGDPSQTVITTVFPTDTYCNSGGCDNLLGEFDVGVCGTPAVKACNRVEREMRVVRLRATNWSGALNFAHEGHSAHFGVANCTGGSTAVGFNRFRGDSGAGIAVEPHTFYHYKLGATVKPARAAEFVAFGKWNEGLDPSGPTYLMNSMSVAVPTGADVNMIACGDIVTEYDMHDITQSGCQPSGVDLCPSSGSCTTSCFKCSGGSC